MFEQADWLMPEEILRWMNFKNEHWAFFSQPQEWIKSFVSSSHRYYPQTINMTTVARTVKELDDLIAAVDSRAMQPKYAGCHGPNSLAGGNSDIGVPALDTYHMLLYTIPGTFHIVAAIIKETLKLLLLGKSGSTKNAITAAIEGTALPRGEPAQCSWVKYGWSIRSTP
jgi:hypothetical protein